MGRIKKKQLQFMAVTLMASSLVTFVPLLGEQSKSAWAQANTQLQTSPSTSEKSTPISMENASPVVKQPEKRYFVYQMQGDQQILLNGFQNLNDAILLAKGTLNTKVIDEVSHAVLWNNALPSNSVPNRTFVQPPKPGSNPSFDDALAFVLDWEGGYSNNPNDHGGSTYKGITQSEYTSYRNSKGLPEQDVRNMSSDELREIYYNGYWLAVHGNDMPYPIAIALFDSGVNCGPGTAMDFLEKSLGIGENAGWNQIRQALSLQTGKAEISLKIMDYREQYYKNIVNNDASQSEFLQGWLNRENALTYKLNEWILTNHFYLDEAKWFLEKNNLYNAAYYAVQSVIHGTISAKESVDLGGGLGLNDRLAFYQDLLNNDATTEIKLELKPRFLDIAKSFLTQKDYDHAASNAMQAFQLGASAQDVVGLADSSAQDTQSSYWNSLLHSGQDLPPSIDAEFMKRQTIPVTGISLGNKSLNLTLQSNPVIISAALSPVNATDQKVIWKSDNDKVVKVDAKGMVTVVGAGTATITASTDDGGKSDACSITVVPNTPAPVATNVTNITLDRTSLTLHIGDSVQKLNAALTTVNSIDQTIKWTTNQPNVVSIDSNGVVTPVGVGTATVTATTNDGGKTAMCTVTVEASTK